MEVNMYRDIRKKHKIDKDWPKKLLGIGSFCIVLAFFVTPFLAVFLFIFGLAAVLGSGIALIRYKMSKVNKLED